MFWLLEVVELLLTRERSVWYCCLRVCAAVLCRRGEQHILCLTLEECEEELKEHPGLKMLLGNKKVVTTFDFRDVNEQTTTYAALSKHLHALVHPDRPANQSSACVIQ